MFKILWNFIFLFDFLFLLSVLIPLLIYFFNNHLLRIYFIESIVLGSGNMKTESWVGKQIVMIQHDQRKNRDLSRIE